VFVIEANGETGWKNADPAYLLEVGDSPDDGAVYLHGPLYTGTLSLSEDGGAVTAIDMPVSATPAPETEQSIAVRIDGTKILTFDATADGDGQVFTPGVKVHGFHIDEAEETSIPDSGDGNPATYTLTPTRTYVELTCSDANGCTVTMGETSIDEGTKVELVNAGANPYTIVDTSGVSEMTGDFTASQYDVIFYRYIGDRWVERGRSDN
jgi:hypothetical protein